VTETTRSALPKRFGPFEFDSRARQLRKHGHTIRLHGQPLEILGLLLERPAEVVLREELRAKLWPEDTFVDFDHSLNAAVNKLREALDDDANNPRFIETVPRRGYRFISAVVLPDSLGLKLAVPEMPVSLESPVVIAESQIPSPHRHRRVFVTALVLVVVLAVVFGFDLGGVRHRLVSEPSVPRIHSIAVLPLENLSKDPEQEYFVDGMTDQLITNLAQISALRVTSRTSAMQYKGTKKSLPEIARELNVDAVVEGTVMWAGGRVRISAQLIEASTDHHLWAASYDRDLRNVLSMQEEVTRAIVSEVRVKLTAQEQARLANTHPINPEAFQLYLKGRYYWYKLNPEALQKATSYYQQALNEDPAYAPAYAGLADAYNLLAFFTVLPPSEVMPKAKAAALKALELDDTLAEADVSLGWASFTYDRDWPAAGKHLERAVALKPAYPLAHSYYSLYLSALGRSEEGLTEAKRALDLDPVSPAIVHYVGVQLYLARRFDEAIEQCRKAQELDPSFAPAHGTLGHVYAAKGMYREALAEYEKYSALSGGSPGSTALVGYAHARLGQRSYALRVLDQLRAASKQRYVPAVSFAIVYVGLGEKEHAFLWLEKAYDERTNSLAYLKVQATWDPLRPDPRFDDLVRRIGLPP
jgi:TolB-like protein/DNA-binding winged helix-turn-helix (wHTH) protein/tetratricopeptide (TPR) repeat protein